MRDNVAQIAVTGTSGVIYVLIMNVSIVRLTMVVNQVIEISTL